MKTSFYAHDTKLPLYTGLGCKWSWVQWVAFPNDIHEIAKQTMSAKDKYIY